MPSAPLGLPLQQQTREMHCQVTRGKRLPPPCCLCLPSFVQHRAFRFTVMWPVVTHSLPSLIVHHHHATMCPVSLCRLPGLGIVYTQATTGLPAVLQHLLINMPALYDVTVLLTLRVITRPYVSQQERFLVRRSSSLSGVYRVIARWGGLAWT